LNSDDSEPAVHPKLLVKVFPGFSHAPMFVLELTLHEWLIDELICIGAGSLSGCAKEET